MSMFGAIYTARELPPRAKMVYMYLRDRSNKQGQCWPGIKTIAKDLNLSHSTVKRALDDLCKADLVEKTRRKRENGSLTSNLYSLKEQVKKKS